MFNRRLALALVVILSLAFGGVALADMPGVPSTPVSDGGITPYIIAGENPGGNRTCAEVGMAFFGDAEYYMYSSERSNYDNGMFDPPLPAGISVDYDPDSKLLSWMSDFGIGAVIVKGSADANVYVYEPQWMTDSGLGAPPTNPGGPYAGLSNITFCWNPEPPPCEWIGETAWAAGTRYVPRGNWATYTPYVADSSVILYAGQTMEAGMVYFSEPDMDDMVTITVTLNEGWRFEDVDENLKIQGYNNMPPAKNPAPGQFMYKYDASGDSYSVTVPAYMYYGVHVNVEWQYCPMP